MIELETLEAVVGAIYNDIDPNAKMMANQVALIFNTAMICQTHGLEKAIRYFKTDKRTNIYEPYLWGDPIAEVNNK